MEFNKIGLGLKKKISQVAIVDEALNVTEAQFEKAAEKLKLRLNKKPDVPSTPAILETEQKIWDGKLIPTNKISDLKYPFETLNPPQSEFYVNRFLDANFIISAATSAGKTVIAELARNGKFLYLSPLKAISQEKWDDWKDGGHTWSNLNVSISTGDYQLTADRAEEMRRADVIVMTSEMLDSRSRNMESERNEWLKDIKTLVIDEFHLLGYSNRGDKLESALIRFTDQNPKCRLVCLSATMPNVEQIASWLTKLNKKKTIIIQSNYRPVILNRHYVTYIQSRNYLETEEIKVGSARRIVLENPTDKFIAFVHTKATGQKLLQTLKESGVKAEFHNADLDKEERIRLQAEFNSNKQGTLRVLVATSTLAWGVNTPADSIIVTGLHRGINLIDNQDIHQMCGRAGRIGKTAKGVGNAYILIPHNDEEKYRVWCERIENIKSRMNINNPNGLETLCFHILAEILGGFVTDEKKLLEWYEKTLARDQDVELSLEDSKLILDKLEEIKMIKKDELGLYRITNLGKVSAYLYYTPFDIYDWYKNFLSLYLRKDNLDNISLSWALGKITSGNIGYIPQPAAIEADRWRYQATKYGLTATNCEHICATYWHLLQGTENFPNGLMSIKRQIQMDFGRIIQALRMTDNMSARWSWANLWEKLEWQIRYGVGEHLLALVKIPQIGAKRANNLYEAGIKTLEDFKNKPQLCRGVLGTVLYDSIIRQLTS